MISRMERFKRNVISAIMICLFLGTIYGMILHFGVRYYVRVFDIDRYVKPGINIELVQKKFGSPSAKYKFSEFAREYSFLKGFRPPASEGNITHVFEYSIYSKSGFILCDDQGYVIALFWYDT
jgi:hypothetical protein